MRDDGDSAGGMSRNEMSRMTTFVVIQVFFLLVSPLAGGWQYEVWSMLDSAILVCSIGLTGLMFVLEQKRARAIVFRVAVVLYVLGVLDMSINILSVRRDWVGNALTAALVGPGGLAAQAHCCAEELHVAGADAEAFGRAPASPDPTTPWLSVMTDHVCGRN